MPLRFLALPSLVQSEILSNLDPFDLLPFSSLSAKTRAILRNSSVKVDLTWFFHSPTFCIELKAPSGRCDIFLSADSSGKKERHESIQLNGFRLFRKYDCWFVAFQERSEKLIAYEQLTKFVFDVFNVQECHLTALTLKGAGFMCNYTKKLKTMFVNHTVTSDDLKTFLEKLQIEEFRISRPSGGLYYSGPLKMDTLKVDGYHWIQKESFWNMECKRLEFSHLASLSIREIRGMISKWMAGSMKNLEELLVNLKHHSSWNIRAQLTDMETFKISENEFRVRRVDGKTARIDWRQPHRFVMTIDKNRVTDKID